MSHNNHAQAPRIKGPCPCSSVDQTASANLIKVGTYITAKPTSRTLSARRGYVTPLEVADGPDADNDVEGVAMKDIHKTKGAVRTMTDETAKVPAPRDIHTPHTTGFSIEYL